MDAFPALRVASYRRLQVARTICQIGSSLAAGLLVPIIGVTGVFLAFGGLVLAAVGLATVACRPLVDLDLEDAIARSSPVGEPPLG